MELFTYFVSLHVLGKMALAAAVVSFMWVLFKWTDAVRRDRESWDDTQISGDEKW